MPELLLVLAALLSLAVFAFTIYVYVVALSALRTHREAMRKLSAYLDAQKYPRADGDVVVLGPEVFTDPQGQTISWKGAHYRLTAVQG